MVPSAQALPARPSTALETVQRILRIRDVPRDVENNLAFRLRLLDHLWVDPLLRKERLAAANTEGKHS